MLIYLVFMLHFSDLHLLSMSNRPAGRESDNAGVLPRWCDVCRNSCSPFPLSSGRQRDGVCYSHHKTHKWHNLDQIPHGPPWIPNTMSHLHVHLATSKSPSTRKAQLLFFFMSTSLSCRCFIDVSSGLKRDRLFQSCPVKISLCQSNCYLLWHCSLRHFHFLIAWVMPPFVLQSPVCKVGCLCRPFSFLDVFTVGWSDWEMLIVQQNVALKHSLLYHLFCPNQEFN